MSTTTTRAEILAQAVADGTISRALADEMLANVERCAEPCPTCRVGRGRQCIDLETGDMVEPHATRTAASR